MRTPLVLSLIFSFFFLSSVSQALALEIRVTPTGTIQIFHSTVLGEETENDRERENEQERENERERENEQERERDRETETHRSESPQPTRVIPSSSNRDLSVTPDKTQSQIELRKRTSNSKNASSTEQMNAKELQVRFPAALTKEQMRKRAEETERAEQRTNSTDQELTQDRLERQQTEEVRLESRQRASGQELELQSRGVKAVIQNGATFNLNPSTNEVTLTTPSGNTMVLKHLPDQAVDRLKAEAQVDPDTTKVEQRDDGSIVYQADGVTEKKLFGLFTRRVRTQVELNDQTGEVTQQDAPTTFLGRLLNRFSY